MNICHGKSFTLFIIVAYTYDTVTRRDKKSENKSAERNTVIRSHFPNYMLFSEEGGEYDNIFIENDCLPPDLLPVNFYLAFLLRKIKLTLPLNFFSARFLSHFSF